MYLRILNETVYSKRYDQVLPDKRSALSENPYKMSTDPIKYKRFVAEYDRLHNSTGSNTGFGSGGIRVPQQRVVKQTPVKPRVKTQHVKSVPTKKSTPTKKVQPKPAPQPKKISELERQVRNSEVLLRQGKLKSYQGGDPNVTNRLKYVTKSAGRIAHSTVDDPFIKRNLVSQNINIGDAAKKVSALSAKDNLYIGTDLKAFRAGVNMPEQGDFSLPVDTSNQTKVASTTSATPNTVTTPAGAATEKVANSGLMAYLGSTAGVVTLSGLAAAGLLGSFMLYRKLKARENITQDDLEKAKRIDDKTKSDNEKE